MCPDLRRARLVRHYAGTVAIVILVACMLALIVANTSAVRLDWIFGSSRASLVWVLVVALAVGWLLGLRTSALVRHRARRDISR